MNYINPPLFLIGESASDDIIKNAEALGFKIVTLPSDSRLPAPTASHADMLLFLIDTKIFCNEIYFKNNQNVFACIKEYGYDVIPCDFEVKSLYPHDVALNQALIGKYVVGKQDSCAKEIIKYVSENTYSYLAIKQGYAKCSTLILNKKAIVTADDSIISIAKDLDIDVLKIRNASTEIRLDGYDYGFIGGASAVYENNVYFFGNIELHQNGAQIQDFCKKHGFNVVSMSKEPLYDLGGAFILPFLNN